MPDEKKNARGSDETDHMPRPENQGRKKSPPYALALIAIILGVGLDIADVTQIIRGLFVRPTYEFTNEYLMVEVGHGENLELVIETIQEQIAGVRFFDPDRTRQLLNSEAQARNVFCEDNEQTYTEAFGAYDEPERVALITACLDNVQSWAVLANFAIKSFDPRPLRQIEITFDDFSNPNGSIDALDGFIDAEVREDGCLYDRLLEVCVAQRTGSGSIVDLPDLGPGETVLIPLFVAWHFTWTAFDENGVGNMMGYDGVALTPVRMPTSIRIDGTLVTETVQGMRATANLVPGFYEGRG